MYITLLWKLVNCARSDRNKTVIGTPVAVEENIINNAVDFDPRDVWTTLLPFLNLSHPQGHLHFGKELRNICS